MRASEVVRPVCSASLLTEPGVGVPAMSMQKVMIDRSLLHPLNHSPCRGSQTCSSPARGCCQRRRVPSLRRRFGPTRASLLRCVRERLDADLGKTWTRRRQSTAPGQDGRSSRTGCATSSSPYVSTLNATRTALTTGRMGDSCCFRPVGTDLVGVVYGCACRRVPCRHHHSWYVHTRGDEGQKKS